MKKIESFHYIAIGDVIRSHADGEMSIPIGDYVIPFEVNFDGAYIMLFAGEHEVRIWLEKRCAGAIGTSFAMRCPSCDQLRRKLLCDGEHIGCRGCFQTRYFSQCASRLQRSREQVWKIRNKLGSDTVDIFSDVPDRPVGIRRRDYARLSRRLRIAQARSLLTCDV